MPSAFAHELLNANPYAFLDDAPLEERRARAVSMRGMVPDKMLGEAGRLDPAAIAELREECWPDVRDEHELHDLLCSLVVVPEEILSIEGAVHWAGFFERLEFHGRATMAEHARTAIPGGGGAGGAPPPVMARGGDRAANSLPCRKQKSWCTAMWFVRRCRDGWRCSVR